MRACTWARWCPHRNVHVVWRTTRRGLLAYEWACGHHLPGAVALGYSVDPPPSPPVTGLRNPCEWPPACRRPSGFKLTRVPCPDGPGEDMNVCPMHLVDARAVGWLPPPDHR